MSWADKNLRSVLDGHLRFLVRRALALPKHQSHLVQWVRSFCGLPESTTIFKQSLDLFLSALGGRVGIMPWPIQ
ncbi:MAG: hypothetical protein D6791_17980 [Chloroflexi bacterium]|nr:MAG: hypothetical protein D6791_17980 [Chloroflexota bacterium]